MIAIGDICNPGIAARIANGNGASAATESSERVRHDSSRYHRRSLNYRPRCHERRGNHRDWIRSAIREIKSFAAGHGTKLEIIFPYDLITQKEIKRIGARAKHQIFSRCKSHIDRADVVIALLDGPQVDDGTAWEIGYFYAKR